MGQTIREKFEIYCSDEGKLPAAAVERSGEGYKLLQTQHAWVVWQAAIDVLEVVATQTTPEVLAYAKRYRYLRDIRRRDCLTLNGPDAGVWCDAEDEDGNLMLLTEDDLDAAIDAATAKERK